MVPVSSKSSTPSIPSTSNSPPRCSPTGRLEVRSSENARKPSLRVVASTTRSSNSNRMDPTPSSSPHAIMISLYRNGLRGGSPKPSNMSLPIVETLSDRKFTGTDSRRRTFMFSATTTYALLPLIDPLYSTDFLCALSRSISSLSWPSKNDADCGTLLHSFDTPYSSPRI